MRGGLVSRLLRGWRPALRIARRDAVRAKGRSALIVSMIALPVLGMTGVDVLVRSAQLDTGEVIARDMGSAQAALHYSGGASVVQSPDLGAGWSTTGPAEPDRPRPNPATLLPGGYRVLTEHHRGVLAQTRAGEAAQEWTELELGDPAFRGRYQLLSGRTAHSRDEVAVTPELLDHSGVTFGDRLRLVDPEKIVRVVGLVRQVGRHRAEQFFAVPGALPVAAGVDRSEEDTVLLAGPRPVSWQDVLRLNEGGFAAKSRAVVLDPPPRAQVPFYTHNDGNASSSGADTFLLVIAVTLVIALAALEVVLLAGAAFAVGARRQSRSLALLTATGGDPSHVRRVVLGGGLVLGLAGATTGVGLGLLLVAGAMAPLERYADADFGHFDVHPLEVLAITLVGIVTGLLAAVLPARSAARQEPALALAGRRGQLRTPRRIPVIGVVVTGLGVTAAGVGSSLALAQATSPNPTIGGRATVVALLIAGGAALSQIGLIVCTSTIVGVAARLSRRLPLPGRLAMRDAARHRGRSAPAIAAVLTAVTGSVALSLYVASLDDADRRGYRPAWPIGTAGVQLLRYAPTASGAERSLVDPDRMLAAVRPQLPAFEATVVRTSDQGCEGYSGCRMIGIPIPTANHCPRDRLDRRSTATETARWGNDWRCAAPTYYDGGDLSGTPVGGPELLTALQARSTKEVRQALAAGGVVVLDRRLIHDGQVTVTITTDRQEQAADAEGRESRSTRLRLPAAFAPSAGPRVPFVLSLGAASRLHLLAEPTTLIMRFHHLPSRDQEDAARKALTDAGLDDVYFSVERGYQSRYGLGLLGLVAGAAVITLGAAGIATGLAQADARADHATLAAVGAAPGLRRTLAASQALAVAGLGTALGIASAFVPAVAFIGASPGLDLVVPWPTLAEVLVALPLLAAACAWLFTRSRVPLDRRLA